LKSVRDRIGELREILGSDKKLKALIVAELRGRFGSSLR
jgi:hypothetical protein